MKRIVVAGLVAVMMAVSGAVWAADEDGSQIKIVSPENGAVVKGDTVEVQYALTKGSKSTHVHAYVDGQYQKGFQGTIKGLTPGKHEIKVVAADHDHKTLAAEAAVTVEVQ